MKHYFDTEDWIDLVGLLGILAVVYFGFRFLAILLARGVL